MSKKDVTKEIPLPNLEIPSFEFLQRRIKALYPSVPSGGRPAKFVARALTKQEKKTWDAVVDVARGAGSVPSAPIEHVAETSDRGN